MVSLVLLDNVGHQQVRHSADECQERAALKLSSSATKRSTRADFVEVRHSLLRNSANCEVLGVPLPAAIVQGFLPGAARQNPGSPAFGSALPCFERT
jgi:hypothetical protein